MAFRPGRNPVPRAAWRGFVGGAWHPAVVRTAYRCRAYPDEAQQQVLARTFGCVRVVWNRTLAERQRRWQQEHRGTTYAETDAALTVMKKDPELAWLNEVSSVPLQQALRHQHGAFQAFFGKRARYPRFKSRHGRQCAHYTRSAFSMRGGELRLAKAAGPLAFVWSWPEVDTGVLDPTMVIVSREPEGRWYVTFAVDTSAPEPLPADRAGSRCRPGHHQLRGDLARRADRQCPAPGAAGPQPRPLSAAAGPLPARLGQPGQGEGQGCPGPPQGPQRQGDFLHRTTTQLVRGNDLIAIEDLAVKNMVRNRCLARAISATAAGASSGASWSTSASEPAAAWS